MIGIGITWMCLFLSFTSSLYSVKNFNEFLSKSAGILVTLLLTMLYFACIIFNQTAISDNLMPSVWYSFSYYVVIFIGVNVLCMINRVENSLDSPWTGLSILGNTFLFAFVIIEWIICSFYKTDGFCTR
jgi:hypothetical protein